MGDNRNDVSWGGGHEGVLGLRAWMPARMHCAVCPALLAAAWVHELPPLAMAKSMS